MSPLTRRPTKDELRQRIMTTADELCRTLGFSKMTVADIAAELGISPAYVYKFFSSKQSIIEACADQRLAEKKACVLASLRPHSTVLDQIASILKSIHHVHKERFKNEGHIYKLVLTAYTEKWACTRYFREFLLKLMTDLVEEGIRKKEFQPADPLDTARILLDSFAWITHPLLYRELEETGTEERIRTQLRFLEKGLSPSLPPKSDEISKNSLLFKAR